MVKRLLSIAVFALLTIFSVQAQQLQRNPAHTSFKPSNPTSSHIRKAASLDGTITFGYGTGNDWGGIGISSTGVAFDVAIFIPGGVFTGSTVQGVNIPVLDTGMTDVSVWVRSALDKENLSQGTTSGPFVSNQYLAVPLDEAVEVPESGVYVGFSFVCSEAYPIAYDYSGAPVPNSMFLRFNGGNWDDYSDQFPPLMLQAFLKGVNLPDYDIDIVSVGQSAQLANNAYSIPVSFSSSSANSISSFDIDVTVDGKTESQHVALDSPVASGFFQSGSFELKGTSPATIGRFNLTLSVKKINGVDYEGEAVGTGLVKNLSKVVARRTVIEEFTGTGCGWCPRGWAGMEYMKANHPDDFIGIAFHKYNSSDPLYYAPYPYLGLTGAPGCIIDRKEEADPYYGTGDNNYGIENDFYRLNKILPEVDVNVNAQWNEAQTAVDVFTDVEFLIDPSNVSLVYVLTADELTGNTSAWNQGNYYYQYTAAQVGNAPGIKDFCSGGKYGKNSVLLTFNDAVIGSSYNNYSQNQGQTVTAADGYKAGNVLKASYSVARPESEAVLQVYHPDLVTAVVLVVNNTTGEILNAGKAHVQDYSTAVTSIDADCNAIETARYNASGVRISAPQRGLNLIRLSDGSVQKVLVK